MQQQTNPQQNMNTGPQQNTMPQPPNVITTKDHAYLEDMLNWNMNVIKKANFFSQNCVDPDIKQTMIETCQLHERHYGRLLNHLQNANQNQPNA